MSGKVALATRIRLTATWFDVPRGVQTKVADFQLGVGSCGKNVTSMSIAFEKGGWISISQWCDDGEMKSFLYHRSQLRGRVEVTHA